MMAGRLGLGRWKMMKLLRARLGKSTAERSWVQRWCCCLFWCGVLQEVRPDQVRRHVAGEAGDRDHRYLPYILLLKFLNL